jgi:hypothetical protein
MHDVPTAILAGYLCHTDSPTTMFVSARLSLGDTMTKTDAQMDACLPLLPARRLCNLVIQGSRRRLLFRWSYRKLYAAARWTKEAGPLSKPVRH